MAIILPPSPLPHRWQAGEIILDGRHLVAHLPLAGRRRPLPQTPSPARRCNNTLTKAEAVPSKFVPPKGFTSDFPSNFRPTKGRMKWRVWLVSDTSSGI